MTPTTTATYVSRKNSTDATTFMTWKGVQHEKSLPTDSPTQAHDPSTSGRTARIDLAYLASLTPYERATHGLLIGPVYRPRLDPLNPEHPEHPQHVPF